MLEYAPHGLARHAAEGQDLVFAYDVAAPQAQPDLLSLLAATRQAAGLRAAFQPELLSGYCASC